VELTIARTWDGNPIPLEEQVSIGLEPIVEGLEIKVVAPFAGDIRPPGDVGAFWGLWEYEVVEVFILGEGCAYTEIELGPHGHHLVLQLEGVRQVVRRELPMDYTTQIEGQRWTGVARLDWRYLPPPPHHLNAYAIRGVGAKRAYHAFSAVHGATPDFHQLGRFQDIGWELSAKALES